MMSRAPADELPLAAEFPAATREQWRKLVEGVLKGAPFDAKLVAKTYDGLAIEPLYGRRADAQPIAGRAAGTPWWVAQRMDHPDPALANSEALHDLENGATALTLIFAGSIGAYGYGLAGDEKTIARALAGIHLDAGIALDLDASAWPTHPAGALAALVQRNGIAAEATNIRFGCDPIGAAASGASVLPWSDAVAPFNHTISELAAQGFRGPFACADGRLIHNAGGSEAQELAYVLAVALEYLRALETGGIALERARAMLYFRLAADADQLLTMAKFRALRKLWARIEAACGVAPTPPFVAAETAWRMMTRRDPYVNMLRATIAVVGAGRSACRSGSPDGSRATPSWCCSRNPTSPRSRILPRARAGSKRSPQRSAARPGPCSRRLSARAAHGPHCSKAWSRTRLPPYAHNGRRRRRGAATH
jgi:methylmalonyl-CoA mutase